MDVTDNSLVKDLETGATSYLRTSSRGVTPFQWACAFDVNRDRDFYTGNPKSVFVGKLTILKQQLVNTNVVLKYINPSNMTEQIIRLTVNQSVTIDVVGLTGIDSDNGYLMLKGYIVNTGGQ